VLRTFLHPKSFECATKLSKPASPDHYKTSPEKLSRRHVPPSIQANAIRQQPLRLLQQLPPTIIKTRSYNHQQAAIIIPSPHLTQIQRVDLIFLRIIKFLQILLHFAIFIATSLFQRWYTMLLWLSLSFFCVAITPYYQRRIV